MIISKQPARFHYIKEKTIALRKKYNLKTPDAIIAATAMCSGYVLVTDDKILLGLKDAFPVSSSIFADIAGR